MNVDFITAIKLLFANYANFKGRSTRAEFWWAQLFLFIVSLVLQFIPFVSGLWGLAVLIPTLAITTRRLHDINRSGWWLLGYYVINIIVCAVCFGALMPAFLQAAVDPQAGTQAIVSALQEHGSAFGIGSLIVLVFGIWYLVWMVKPSGPDNQYGPNPYGE